MNDNKLHPGIPMNVPIIGAKPPAPADEGGPNGETCRECAFYFGAKEGGDCRYNPPLTQLIMTRTQIGQNIPQPVSHFTQVRAGLWCGHWQKGDPTALAKRSKAFA